MARQPWDDVFDRIRVKKNAEYLYPFRPTAADLGVVEAELGCKLPASYRAFVERFGAGSIEGLMRLKSLVVPAFGVPSLAEFTREWQGYIDEGEIELAERYPAFGKKVVAVADDGGRGAFAFSAPPERWPWLDDTVYELDRNTDLNGRRHLSPTPFADLLHRLHGVAHEMAADEQKCDPELLEFTDEIIFQPHPLLSSPKRRFTKRTLKTWLTANTNAARNLALAIREENRVELFPVLGDALEDAGCSNVHLLRACRDGNPQADGDWVLAVLLGAPRSR